MRAWGSRRGSRPWNVLPIGLTLLVSLGIVAPRTAAARPELLDLREAVVVTSARLSEPESAAIDLLLDEVEKRSIIRWEIVHQWPADATPVIAVGTAASAAEWAGGQAPVLGLAEESLPAEGYRIRVVTGPGYRRGLGLSVGCLGHYQPPSVSGSR